MNKTKLAEIIRKMSDEERQELADEIGKPPKSARWKPECGDNYWCTDNAGWIRNNTWYGDIVDHHRYARGEVFRTEEEFLVNDKRIKAIQKIKDYIADRMIGREPMDWSDNEQRKCYVHYSHSSKKLQLYNNTRYQELEHCFYGHEDIIGQAIVDLEDEYKLMLEIGE